ncbi:MAG: hypothetical protein LBM05_01910 [Endomicrobium sp.]|jgi:hypothetical protein|nr:hypothetical protein [Endomicrobium sp.]
MNKIVKKISPLIVAMTFIFANISGITSLGAPQTPAETTGISNVLGSVFDERTGRDIWTEDSPLETPTVITIFGNDANNLVEPGSSGKYGFVVKDDSNKELRYSITFTDKDNLTSIPIQYRLYSESELSEGATEVSETTVPWKSYDELKNSVNISGTLRDSGSRRYYIEWRWPYAESEVSIVPTGSDDFTRDTNLGTSTDTISGTLLVHVNMEMEEDEINLPQSSGEDGTGGTVTSGGTDGTGRTGGTGNTGGSDGTGNTGNSSIVTQVSNFVKTGDNAQIILLVTMCLIAISVVIANILYFRRKKTDKE